MRRGINIRKKKRKIISEINKKSLRLITILVALLIICLIIYFFFIQNIFIKKNFEKHSMTFSSLNENIPFSINKILLFSSATGESSNVNQNILSIDLSQYCDIGIYLNNSDKENVSIKSLYVNNISISSPELGTPCLYKKQISDLGKSSFSEENIIQDEFYFNIIDSLDTLNYENFELSNDLSTPVTLGFYNKNIKQDFLTDNNEILYNGILLKDALIPQTSLNCSVSFSINIITNTEQHYMCNINFDIPFEDENTSLYNDGYITKELANSQTNNFIRIK